VAASHPVLYYPMANNQAGLALLGQGRAEDSLPWFSEAVRAGRSQREAFLYDRALALVALGRRGEAERDLAAALRLRPGMDKARVMLGVALAERGEYGGAVRHLEMAARSDPSLVMARVELAWVLAACPDDRVRDGRRALKLGLAARAATGGRSRRALEVLAACYAENGMFEEAVRTARLALSCPGGGEGAETTSEGSSAASSAAGAAEHSARVEAALRLYESGQPLRLVPVPQGGGAGRGAAPGPGASRGP
jgi:tetratricopeptide (TPR) repeat protein